MVVYFKGFSAFRLPPMHPPCLLLSKDTLWRLKVSCHTMFNEE